MQRPNEPHTPPHMGTRLRSLAGEGVRLGLLSLASLALGYVLTVGMTEFGGLDPKAAYSIAIIICSVLNFFGCRHLVFRGTRAPLWEEAAKFFPSVLLFRFFEIMLFSLFVTAIDGYHLAYFATAAISMAGKLLVSKFFIFRRTT